MTLRREETPNKWVGGNSCQVIIIHQWDDPAKHPTLDGVVNHFKDSASQVSAHYVVQNDLVVQFADETDRCWHAVVANPFAIGIEVDPNFPGATKQTVRELVAAIRSRRGAIPLKKHSAYVATSCGKDINLADYEGGGMDYKAAYEDAKPFKDAIVDNKHLWEKTIGQDVKKAKGVLADLDTFKEEHQNDIPAVPEGSMVVDKESLWKAFNKSLE
jgi:hypothetical protein